MPQLHLRFPAEQPQIRLRFPRPAVRSAPKNPFLSALECDFRHPDDGRKWKARCWLKRQLCRGYSKLGYASTEHELARFLGIPPRTVRWGIRILKQQGFVSNIKRQGFNGPMLRGLHPSLLRNLFERQVITYRTQPLGRAGFRYPFALKRESCRPTRRESCRVNSPKSGERLPVGLPVSPARPLPQDLGAGLRRRSSRPTFQGNPTQNRYSRIRLLAIHAERLLRGTSDFADLADELKWFAAENAIEYGDTPAGCNDPIQQAIQIAIARTNPAFFAPFGRRR